MDEISFSEGYLVIKAPSNTVLGRFLRRKAHNLRNKGHHLAIFNKKHLNGYSIDTIEIHFPDSIEKSNG